MIQRVIYLFFSSLKKWGIFSLIFTLFSIQAEEVFPEWNQVLNSLSQDEKIPLEMFFRTMMVNSEGGFVLFGSKPSCIEGIIVPETCKIEWIGRRNHRKSVDLWEGYQVWQKYFASLKSSQLLISVKQQPNHLYSDWIHLIWINPKKFKAVISENLSLFQYVLGPDITSQGLLDYLADPAHDILEDYSLQGILLGFGAENSLYYRRLELIEKELYSKEHAPFKAKYERLDIPDPCNGLYMGFDLIPTLDITPSFKYPTLAQEYQNLLNIRSSSLKNRNQQINSIPMFAIFKNDEKTVQILLDYEIDRLKLQELLAQDNFLEQTLKIIFE